MSLPEIKQQAIGLLTAACTADIINDDEFAALIAAVFAGDNSWTLNFDLTADADTDRHELVRTVADKVSKLVAEHAATEHLAFNSTLVAAFVCLAREYEAACPDADVPGFLQRFALSMAGDDDPPG